MERITHVVYGPRINALSAPCGDGEYSAQELNGSSLPDCADLLRSARRRASRLQEPRPPKKEGARSSCLFPSLFPGRTADATFRFTVDYRLAARESDSAPGERRECCGAAAGQRGALPEGRRQRGPWQKKRWRSPRSSSSGCLVPAISSGSWVWSSSCKGEYVEAQTAMGTVGLLESTSNRRRGDSRRPFRRGKRVAKSFCYRFWIAVTWQSPAVSRRLRCSTDPGSLARSRQQRALPTIRLQLGPIPRESLSAAGNKPAKARRWVHNRSGIRAPKSWRAADNRR
jgi:hypothetical protein